MRLIDGEAVEDEIILGTELWSANRPDPRGRSGLPRSRTVPLVRNGHETANADLAYAERFDRLFTQGSAAALAGTHHREIPLFDGGRYGLSVALLPPADDARRLGELACEATEVAGGGHWMTGSEATVHFTVRCLEPYRDHLPAGDPFVARAGEAVARAAARSRPVR